MLKGPNNASRCFYLICLNKSFVQYFCDPLPTCSLGRCDLRDHFRKKGIFFFKKSAGKSALHGVGVPLQLKMGKRGGGVPDRWEDYSNIGSVIEGTRFLAFKVPLRAALLAQVKQKKQLESKCDCYRFLGYPSGKEKLGCFRPYNCLSHYLAGG